MVLVAVLAAERSDPMISPIYQVSVCIFYECKLLFSGCRYYLGLQKDVTMIYVTV